MRQLICTEFGTRKFGIELEVTNEITKRKLGSIVKLHEKRQITPHDVVVTKGIEGWANTVQNNYWHIKFDRSCGWEVASYIGSGFQDVNHMANTASFLASKGAKTNLNCGFHIHVETSDFNVQQMNILMGRWLKVENILLSICHPSRTNNPYCKTIRTRWQMQEMYEMIFNKKPDVLDVWEQVKPINLGFHHNEDKRVTLNAMGFAISCLTKYCNRNTVELRMPECQLDVSHVKNWIYLIVNFVETSRTASIANDLQPCENLLECLMYLGLGGIENNVVLDPKLFETKVWFLNKIITFSKSETMIKQAKELLEFITLIQ